MQLYYQIVSVIIYLLLVSIFIYLVFSIPKILRLFKNLNKVTSEAEKIEHNLKLISEKQAIITQGMNVGLVRAIKTAIPLYFLIKPRQYKKPSKLYLMYRFYEVFKVLK